MLAVLLVVSLALLPLVPPRAAASSAYTENLTIYIAGSNAMWSMRFGGINASNAYLTKLEAVQGLNWYNVTAINTSGVVSDFQVFGPEGYNLIPLPFIPEQGLFLGVGASSYGAALSAAQALGPYFVTTFSSVSNGTGVYYFFSPVSLSQIAPATLMRYIPVSDGGFATALGYTSPASTGNFTKLPGAMITLGGQKSSSSFTHYLTLSAMTANALSSSQAPAILTDLGKSLTYLQASNKSTLSVIDVHALDGIMLPDNLTGVSNNLALFTGTYSLSVSPGSKVTSINATLLQQPPQLLVTRSLDAGILAHNQNVSVTINFRNLSNSTTVIHAILTDNWWMSYNFFKLVAGNSTMTLPKLSPGGTLDMSYELEYTGNSTQQVTIPMASASYSFEATNPTSGKLYNSTMSLYSDVNGGTFLLGEGVRDPVLFAYLSTSTGIGGSVGSAQGLKVVITNIGNRTASSVAVNGKQVGALSAGSTETVPISVKAASLIETNVTEGYTVSYITPEGRNLTLSTNSIHVVFSHSSMNLGLGMLAVNSTIAPLSGGRTNLTLTFTTANEGLANVSSIDATGALPVGLSCGRSFGKGIACSNGMITLSYSNLQPKASDEASMSFNITQPQNFIVDPFYYNFTSSGYSFAGRSNGAPVPTGLVLSKSFNPDLLFGGMGSSVSVRATNSGPYSFYNVTVSTPNDQFDTVSVSGPPTTKTNSTISPSKTLSLLYNVSMSSSTGNQTGAAVTATYYFGGVKFSKTSPSSWVVIYKPPVVTITSSPASPVEGKSFSILISISNPSPLSLSNLQFSLPIPPEVHFSSLTNATAAKGEILINAAQLAGNEVYLANLTGSASSGVSIPFSGSKASFDYAGQTITLPPLTAGIAVNENVLTRYVLPTGLALVVLLAVAVFVRRMARVSAPASLQ